MYKGPKRKFNRRRRAKTSEYGSQLVEKQKLRKLYSIREKTLKTYYSRASERPVDVDISLIKELERRLDNVVYRLGWAQTRAQAAQIVNHGHLLVNKKRITIPSYQVRKNDEVEVKESKKKLHLFKNLDPKLGKQSLPPWLGFSAQDKLKAKIAGEVSRGDFNEPINLSLVLEFYSR